MGTMDLLKANFYGKVGKMVGSKWHSMSVVKSYTKPSNPNTPLQQDQRSKFSVITSFLAQFTGDMRRLTALDISNSSPRNAIIKLNKHLFTAQTIDLRSLQLSRGSLPAVGITSITIASADGTGTATLTLPTSANLSAKAVVVVCGGSNDPTQIGHGGFLVSQLVSKGATVPIVSSVRNTDIVQCYAYLIDWRGSSRVGGPSAELSVTPS